MSPSAPLGTEPPSPIQQPLATTAPGSGGIRMATPPPPPPQTPEMDITGNSEQDLAGLTEHFHTRWLWCRDGRKSSGIEAEWTQAALDFNGEYNSTLKSRLDKLAPNRSRAFVKLARSVVGGARALIMQAYAGDQNGFPWQVKPASDPDMSGVNIEVLNEARDMAAAQLPMGGPREAFLQNNNFEDMIHAKRADADTRCESMSKEIQDNLDEMNWTERFMRSIDPMLIYGTAVFMGPKSVKKRWSKWHRDEKGNWTTALKRSKADAELDVKELRPEFEARDLWSCYPDPSAKSRDELKDNFFRNVLSRHQVLALRRIPGVKADVIDQLMVDFADKGNWTPEEWEFRIEGNKEVNSNHNHDRFVVLEYTGYVSGTTLDRAGIKVAKNLLGEECLVNALICDDRILKCVVSNIEPPEIPIYFVPYESVPNRLWGHGIPKQMDDSLDRFNAVERAKFDNMALTAIPQLWLDMGRIQDPSKADNMFAGKIWAFNEAEGSIPMGLIQIQSIIPQCNEIQKEILMHIQKETNLPDFAMGIASSAVHNRTAEGLSIQRDQALAFIRSVVGNIDTFLTAPMIRALYDWNMSFNPNEDIKGAFDVVAKGVTGAVSRDVISQRIGALMHQWGNELKYWLKPDKAVPMWLDSLGLDSEGCVNTPKEAQAAKAEEAAMNANAAEAPKRVQPTMPKENALMECFQNTDPQSPMYGPIYEQVLDAYGIGSARIAAALDAINKASAQIVSPLIPPDEQAALMAPVTGIVTGQPAPGNPGPQPTPPITEGATMDNAAIQAGGAVNGG